MSPLLLFELFLVLGLFLVGTFYFLTHHRNQSFASSVDYITYFLAWFLIFVLVAFRLNDPDMSNYRDIFKLSKAGAFPTEPVYVLLNKVFPSHSYRLFLITISALLIYCKAKAYTLLFKPTLIIPFAYFSTIALLQDMIQFRQSLATACLMFATYFLLKKQNKKFFILIILASQLHITSIIFLVVFFFRNSNISVIKIALLFTIVFFLSKLISYTQVILLSNVIGETKAAILSQATTSAAISIRHILILSYFLIMSKFDIPDSKKSLFFNIFMTGILMRLLFSGLGDAGFRVYYYFCWTEPLLFALAAKWTITQMYSRKIPPLYQFAHVTALLIVTCSYFYSAYTFIQALPDLKHYKFFF